MELREMVSLAWSLLLNPFTTPSPLTPNFAQKCTDFQPTKYFPTATATTQYIPPGTNLTFPQNDASCSPSFQLVPTDLCRVSVAIPTSSDSGVTMELWLPRTWSGRFLATGNGGLGGCIKYEDMEYGASHGFAVTGSNNGHNGNTGKPFYQNQEVVVDFAWRALHTSVDVGKTLTRAFYGRPHDKSYYVGCSFGGLQGIRSAFAFPEAFDGIVAGSPAVDFNNLGSWRAGFLGITGDAESADFITQELWTGLIHDEVLRQCDGIDGARDGIIEDPSLCQFQPDFLRCKGDQTGDCLTSEQVEVVHRVFSAMEYEGGGLVFPAMQPGSEIEAAGELYTGRPFRYSEEWFRYVVYDPSWDLATFTLHDARIADELNPAGIRTWPDNLTAFKKGNGKLITFHGQQDGKITSFNSARFYDHLSERMQLSSDGLDEFFRFFRISGMGHCQSGPGAWAFGQGGGGSAAGIPFVKKRNALAALVAWVEEGEAPDTIQGTKFVDDRPELGEAMRRGHCRYPLRNTYVGDDSSLPESWAPAKEYHPWHLMSPWLGTGPACGEQTARGAEIPPLDQSGVEHGILTEFTAMHEDDAKRASWLGRSMTAGPWGMMMQVRTLE